MRNAVNELSFLLVTHTVDFDAWFSSYGVLNSGQAAENFLDRLDIPMKDQDLRVEDARILTRVVNEFRRSLIQLSNAYSNAHF
jgi:hypothetical protein